MIRFLNNLLTKIKIIRIAKILRINPQFFFDVVLFHFSKLFRAKVDDNLIIFGSANGKAFIGNPKYIYYYLKQNSDYKLVWFSKSKSLIRELKLNGINCVHNFSLEAIRLLRKARAVFVSHGWGDILPVKFSPRTVVVQTWHGADIKIIGKHPYVTKYINSKWSTLARLKIRYYQFFDYVLNPSGEEKPLNISEDVFKFPKERILSFGYPRNDILFLKDPNIVNNLKKFYEIPDNIKRIILYAPTYREKFSTQEPFNDKDLIEINQMCNETDTIFLMKPHLSEATIILNNFKNIMTVRKDADIQELLLLTDILITDYSSVYCDYLLLNRPVLLYTYDYNEYVGSRGIFYDHLEDIAPGPLLYSSKELINAIKNIDEIKKKYKDKYIKLRNYFNKYLDGKSTERLLRFLKLI